MAAFEVPSSTKDPFSCQESSLTVVNSTNFHNFLSLIPAQGLETLEEAVGREGVGLQEAGRPSLILPVQIHKMLPQGKSSRVQVQN